MKKHRSFQRYSVIRLLGANNRVKDLDFGTGIDWSKVSVTEKESVNKNH